MIVILTGNDFMRVIPRVVDAYYDQKNQTAKIKSYTSESESIETDHIKDVTCLEVKDDNGAISIADSRYNIRNKSEEAKCGPASVRPETTYTEGDV